ncbi:MAG: porin, partial [Muribaculaceae bacterium]|nr:porin [Muribaculaceae bacterium]
LIPIPANQADMRHFGTTPAGTALYFVVLGRCRLGNYKLYIEANFNGFERRGLSLKKAYATLGDLTVGYAESTFSDPAAMPPTVDAQGATNKIGKTDVLVRWMHTFGQRFTVAASAETPSTAIGYSAESMTGKSSDWLPDGAAFVQYQWGNNGMEHVRLSGIVRALAYRDLVSSTNRTVAGWGVQLSSVAHPWPQVTTYATASYGKGYAGLSNDFMAGNYDLVADPACTGRLYAPRTYGYCLGAQYNFTPALFASASFSQNRYLPDHSVPGNEYRRGWLAAANIFWNIVPRLQVGAEFAIGRRVNADHAARMAHRVGAMCQFAF